ncbi:MAG TPA: prepilin-type N-terminal cleavage/methylation domain-containing protein [Rhodoferax sp.]
MNNPQRKIRSRGFTLIELIIFIVVVSAGLAGILSVMNTVVKSSADPMVRKQTIAIAESLLEEILLKNYCYPDPAGSDPPVCGTPVSKANRSDYDNVSDYNGYSSTGIFDMTGVATPGLEKYNISSVVVDTAATLGTLSVKRVTVYVTGPQGTISLTGYRANY